MKDKDIFEYSIKILEETFAISDAILSDLMENDPGIDKVAALKIKKEIRLQENKLIKFKQRVEDYNAKYEETNITKE